MIENSSADLVLLNAETTVTVTREEDHQAELAGYPVAPGMQRHVAVELAWCTVESGRHRGERAVEVRLDGRRVGELTHLMSQRYAPLVVQLTARGSRPGCRAVLQAGVRGTEVTLRLPKDGSGTIPLPAPAHQAPHPTYQALPPVPPQRRSPPRTRRPVWIAAGAAVAVVFIAAVANGDTPDDRTASPLTTTLTATSPTTTTTSTTSATTTTTTTTTTLAAVPSPQAVQPAAPTTTTTRQTTQAPPPPPAEPAPQSACDPNYSGCVPVASDVDCQGGSGDGPAYVTGPIRVIGTDVYRLDHDKDGFACE